MTLLVAAIRIAGLIQLADVSANLVLPKKIQCRENLARVSPIMRQVFLVHWLYILLTLVIFGLACLLFAPELAGGTPLARFVDASLAVFWLSRAAIEVFYFDAAFRQQNRAADVAFTLAALFQGCVFVIAATGVIR